MKRFVFFLSFIFISINLHSCAEMAAGLSNFNQANGSQCRVIICDSELYHDGEYKDAVLIRNNKGNDISSKERSWVASQQERYLNYSFGIYYATSPYSNGEYRFTNYCESYY
jgi:hypothetical protein